MAKIENMHYTICLKLISSSAQVALPPAFAPLEQRGVYPISGPEKCVKSNHWLVIRLSNLWDSYTSPFVKFCKWWPPGFNFDVWWYVWPCDRHFLVILTTTSGHYILLRHLKMSLVGWSRWWYTRTSSLKISNENNFCTNFSIGHCQFGCMQMQAKFLGEQICLSSIWNSVFSANY